jgi:ABC-type glycerol-3-phosphate transport system substrate-binding protein
MKYLKLIKKPKIYVPIILLVLALVLIISNQSRYKEPTLEMSSISQSDAYDDYYIHVKETWDSDIIKDFEHEITVDEMTGPKVSGEDFEDTGTLIRLDEDTKIELSFNLAQAGIYQIAIKQRDISTSILPNALSIKVNGAYPYEEAQNIELTTFWQFSQSDFNRDRYGNEILPDSDKTELFYLNHLYDSTALNSRPLQFELNEGLNTLEIIHESGDFLVESIVITGVENIPTYEDYLSIYEDNAMGEEDIITIGAESFISKSNPSTRLTSVTDPSATAYDSEYRLLNAVEGYSFRSGNDTLVYQVEVESAGFYYLSFKYRQNYLMQMPVFREVTINGQVPFQELTMVPFHYTNDYANKVLGDENPYKIYLNEGFNHLSLRVVLDPYQRSYEHITQIMDEITDLSLEIKRLTGNTVDNYRNWDLETYIPDVEDRLEEWINTLDMIYQGLLTYSNYDEPGELTNILLAKTQLEKLAEDVNDIPNNMLMLADGDSSTSQLLGTIAQVLLENGLDLEQMNFVNDIDEVPSPRANVFVRVFESIKRFFLSFKASDYAVDETEEGEIEIWVNYPRQYIEIMQQMIDSGFTEETGVKVQLSLMPDENKLILANSADRAPDIALGVNHWIPYEFAIRNASLDLRQFDGYEEVVSHFSPGVMIPYVFEDGVYGFPQTQNFWVTFYREDILGGLGSFRQGDEIVVPDTWQEVIEVLPELQRYGMNYFEPLAQYGGFKPFVATIPFIYQFGGTLYSEDGMSTLINSEENLRGMRMMTDLFTIYDLPIQVPNFYNHFRAGTLPIGIGDLATYLQLTIAAPEIAGKWNIAPHPGVLNEETGKVERWAASGAQSIMILADTELPEESWDFIEWWMSTDIQVSFAERLQTTYGTEFLWNTANLEAFAQTSLPKEHLDVILEQWEYAMEASRIPGTYMVEREISNAWNTIIFDDSNPRIALDEAVKTANREILYRMEEFGYVEDGQILRSYTVPTIYNIENWLKERDNDE